MYANIDLNGNIIALSQVQQEGWIEVPDDSVLWEHPNEAIKRQIVDLEAQQTPRLIREAALGDGAAFTALQQIEMDITALRAQLI